MTDISVVIPTFNRAGHLRRCLDALDRQTAEPNSFEVIVVNDGSTDETAALLAALQPAFPLRVLSQANGGQPAALNAGIEAAHGAFCLFLDDDIVAEPQLVSEHRGAQLASGGVIGLGAMSLDLGSRGGGLVHYFATWWQEHYARLEDGSRQADFWACYSGNLSAPTELIQAVGGFDQKLSRSFDVELAYRLEQAGAPIAFLPRAAGAQRYEKGFREIVEDFDRAGAAAVLLQRRHPELLRYAPLGDFSQGGTRTLLLRRLLLAVRAPVWPLAVVDRLLARRPPANLYRFLQLYCFWRSLRRALDDRETWRRLTRGTVILMYHAIGDRGESASRFVMPSARFRRQVAWLRLRRRPILSLDEYVGYQEQQRLPPAGSVVITFDDGYADVAQHAAPRLLGKGMSATVFMVTDSIGAANGWDAVGPLVGRRLMSWPQLHALRDAGITIGAHTASHPRLTDLDSDLAEREIARSRSVLEAELGSPVRHFAYPYGKTSDGVEDLVRGAEFTSACGIKPGLGKTLQTLLIIM